MKLCGIQADKTTKLEPIQRLCSLAPFLLIHQENTGRKLQLHGPGEMTPLLGALAILVEVWFPAPSLGSSHQAATQHTTACSCSSRRPDTFLPLHVAAHCIVRKLKYTHAHTGNHTITVTHMHKTTN